MSVSSTLPLGRRAALLCLAAASLGLLAPGTARAQDPDDININAGRVRALLIGVDRYNHPEYLPPLSVCVKDVKAMFNALTQERGSIVELMVRGEQERNRPTRENVLQMMRDMTKFVRPQDTFLLYFSGHGITYQGIPYLLTQEADLKDGKSLQQTAISIEDLKEVMKDVRARSVVFMIDACRSIAELGQSGGPGGKAGVGLGEAMKAKDPILQQFEDASRVGSAKQTAIFFACSEGESAWTFEEKEQSAFSYFLVEGLRGKAGDATKDRAIGVMHLSRYLKRNLPKWALDRGKNQNPKFILNPNPQKTELIHRNPSGDSNN